MFGDCRPNHDYRDFSRRDVINVLNACGGHAQVVLLALQDTEFTSQEEGGFAVVDQLMDAGHFSLGDDINVLNSSRGDADDVFLEIQEVEFTSMSPEIETTRTKR